MLPAWCPCYIGSKGMTYHGTTNTTKNIFSLLTHTIIMLVFTVLISFHFTPPLQTTPRDEHSGPLTPHDHTLQDTAKLPLAIKENDVEYQFHRVVMYSRLLESYPHSQALIQKEASTDISPLRRGEIWAALLDVNVRIRVLSW